METGEPLDMGDSARINKSQRWGRKKEKNYQAEEEDEEDHTTSESSSSTLYWVAAGIAVVAVGAIAAIKTKNK